MKVLISMALAAAVLTGCASQTNWVKKSVAEGNYAYNPARSEALNVAVATGLTTCDKAGKCSPLDDTPRQKLAGSLRGLSDDELGKALNAANAIGSVGQIAGLTTGVTSGWGSLGLSVMTFFMNGPTDPAGVTQVLMWMPASKADSAEQAHQIGKRIVSAAFSTEMEKIPSMHGIHLALGCWTPKLSRVTPSWIGSGASYVWQNWRRGKQGSKKGSSCSLNLYGKHKVKESTFRALLAKVSGDLPKWAYIYTPPKDDLHYPVMFNQGKKLLFVQPLAR